MTLIYPALVLLLAWTPADTSAGKPAPPAATPAGAAGVAGSFTRPGATETVSLDEVEVSSHADSPEAREDGFVTTNMRADLVLSDGTRERRIEVGAWENGWEWGETWTFAGVAPMGSSGRHAVVLHREEHGEGGCGATTQKLWLVALEAAGPVTLWEASGHAVRLETASAERIVAAIEKEDPSCLEDGRQPAPPQRVRLRYDAKTRRFGATPIR